MKKVIYDCEIIKAIPSKDEPPEPDIEYCDGWRDFENMGVSVICAYESGVGYRVFLEDNFGEFAELIEVADCVIGFNSIAFDNKLIEAAGFKNIDEKSYDILVETWLAAGLEPEYSGSSHNGFGLDALAKENLGQTKSGTGAFAAIQWQRGQYGAVIDYCLRDVVITKRLLEIIEAAGVLYYPKHPNRSLSFRKPWYFDVR